jgi:hypothetical protein
MELNLRGGWPCEQNCPAFWILPNYSGYILGKAGFSKSLRKPRLPAGYEAWAREEFGDHDHDIKALTML